MIPFLQAQGYIEESDGGWLTTASGDTVSGSKLAPGGPTIRETITAVEMAAEREFLRQLKAKSLLLDIRPYEDWMGSRSHRKLP